MKFVDFVPILLGLTMLVLSHFMPESAGTLLPVGGALVGQGLPNLTALRRAPPKDLGNVISVGLAFIALVLGGCSESAFVKEKKLEHEIIACAKAGTAEAGELQSALACLEQPGSEQGLSCLLLLPPTVDWGRDEVSCVLRAEATASR